MTRNGNGGVVEVNVLGSPSLDSPGMNGTNGLPHPKTPLPPGVQEAHRKGTVKWKTPETTEQTVLPSNGNTSPTRNTRSFLAHLSPLPPTPPRTPKTPGSSSPSSADGGRGIRGRDAWRAGQSSFRGSRSALKGSRRAIVPEDVQEEEASSKRAAGVEERERDPGSGRRREEPQQEAARGAAMANGSAGHSAGGARARESPVRNLRSLRPLPDMKHALLHAASLPAAAGAAQLQLPGLSQSFHESSARAPKFEDAQQAAERARAKQGLASALGAVHTGGGGLRDEGGGVHGPREGGHVTSGPSRDAGPAPPAAALSTSDSFRRRARAREALVMDSEIVEEEPREGAQLPGGVEEREEREEEAAGAGSGGEGAAGVGEGAAAGAGEEPKGRRRQGVQRGGGGHGQSRAQSLPVRDLTSPKKKPSGFHCEWVSGRSAERESVEAARERGEGRGAGVQRMAGLGEREGCDAGDAEAEQFAAHAAARHGDLARLQELLPPEAVPEAQCDRVGFSPLHFAACYGHGECVGYLLQHQGSVEAASVHGWTPLHVAARAGRAEVLEQLLAAGSAVDARDKFEWTSLHNAACKGDVETIKVLLRAKADINLRDRDGWTALHFAARFNNVEAVEHLIGAGADVTVKDVDGWTATHNCARNGQNRCVQVLLEKRADLFAVNRFGETPLHVASRKGKSKVVAIISEVAKRQGCLDRVRQAEDSAGNTAEDVASTTLLREMLNKEATHGTSWYHHHASDDPVKPHHHHHHTTKTFARQLGNCSVM